jgi:hypothetical protein
MSTSVKNLTDVARILTNLGYDFISERVYKTGKRVLVFQNPQNLNYDFDILIGSKFNVMNVENKTIFIKRK